MAKKELKLTSVVLNYSDKKQSQELKPEEIRVIMGETQLIIPNPAYSFLDAVQDSLGFIEFAMQKAKANGATSADLFGIVDEELAKMKKVVSPKVSAREFGQNYIKEVLFQEVMLEDAKHLTPKYKDLRDKATQIVDAAVKKMEEFDKMSDADKKKVVN